MPKVGDIVKYNPADGRSVVDAEVTQANEDGSISILYPHPNGDAAAAGVRASAEGVLRGSGSYQYDDGTALPAPTITEAEVLSTRYDVLVQQVSQLEAKVAVLEKAPAGLSEEDVAKLIAAAVAEVKVLSEEDVNALIAAGLRAAAGAPGASAATEGTTEEKDKAKK